MYFGEEKIMKKNKNYEFKTYPYLVVTLGMHMILFLCFIFGLTTFDSIERGTVFTTICKCLLIISPILFIVTFVYGNFFGWNSPIYFTKEKMYQKRHGKLIEWKWDEIKEIRCKTHKPLLLRYPYYPPRIRIISSTHSYTVTISLERYVRERILNVMTNENVKARYLEILEQCDFPYL